MQNFFPVLRQCQLFSGIAENDLLVMLRCLNVTVQQYRKGQTLIAEGGKAGKVRHCAVRRCSAVAHRLFRQQEHYGKRCAVSDLRGILVCAEADAIPIQVVASEPCKIMLIDGSRILHACGNGCDFHHQVIFNLLKMTARKNLVFHQKLEITSRRSTREKLLTYLNQQAKQHRSRTFTIPFDRQELADFLEVDRSGLSAEISKLRKEGVLESERRTFRLL